jgi:hypothetical protein
MPEGEAGFVFESGLVGLDFLPTGHLSSEGLGPESPGGLGGLLGRTSEPTNELSSD